MSEYPWDYAHGSKIIFRRGDQVWTQQVESVQHSAQPYVGVPELSRRERFVRRFTPRRWRKPVPQQSSGTPVVTIKTTGALWSREDPSEACTMNRDLDRNDLIGKISRAMETAHERDFLVTWDRVTEESVIDWDALAAAAADALSKGGWASDG